jgi:hypothetical protein
MKFRAVKLLESLDIIIFVAFTHYSMQISFKYLLFVSSSVYFLLIDVHMMGIWWKVISLEAIKNYIASNSSVSLHGPHTNACNLNQLNNSGNRTCRQLGEHAGRNFLFCVYITHLDKYMLTNCIIHAASNVINLWLSSMYSAFKLVILYTPWLQARIINECAPLCLLSP